MELISTKEIWAALERARVALNEGAQLMQRNAKDREALIVAADLIEVSEGVKRVNGLLGHASPGIRFSVSLAEAPEPAKEKAKRQPRKSKEPSAQETSTGA